LSGGGPGNGALLISGRFSSSPDGTGWYAYVLWAIALEFLMIRKDAGDHDVIIYLGRTSKFSSTMCLSSGFSVLYYSRCIGITIESGPGKRNRNQ
jgi:hypothetical protein